MIHGKKYAADALFLFPLVDRGTIDFVSGPTIAAGDAKLFTDRQISANTAAEVVAFTSGSEEPENGDTLAGATSGTTATFMFAVVTSGTWVGGDAAGFLFLKALSGALQSENLNISGGTSNVATIGGDSTAGLFASLGNGLYAIALTATEMTCAQGAIHLVDSATKEWEDQAIVFETYGHASAQHAADFDDSVRLGLTALPNAAAEAAGGLYTRGTGAGQINQAANGEIDANVVDWGGTGATLQKSTMGSLPQVDVEAIDDVVPAVAFQNAVFDEAAGDHVGAGTFGKLLNDVLADTNELQTDWANGGRLDLIADAIKAKTDNLPASPASTTNITAGTITTVTNLTNAPTAGDLTATMKASVNAEVVDVLATDTYAEPGQGNPSATTSLAAKLNYLYKWFRNKRTQNSTTQSFYDDAGTTVDQKRTISDDGSTHTTGEIASGP